MASGRLRDRSGQYSLHCEEIEEYSTSGAQKTAVKNPRRSPGGRRTKSTGKTASAKTPGRTEKTSEDAEEPTRESIRTAAAPLAGVVLRITESEDQPRDAGSLRDAILVLLKNPGMEPVYLKIQTPDGPVMMELPVINTNYSPELTRRNTADPGAGHRIPGGRRGPGGGNRSRLTGRTAFQNWLCRGGVDGDQGLWTFTTPIGEMMKRLVFAGGWLPICFGCPLGLRFLNQFPAKRSFTHGRR